MRYMVGDSESAPTIEKAIIKASGKNRDKLIGLAVRPVHDPAISPEDVLQEVLLNAWRNRNTISPTDEGGNPDRYLTTAVHNRSGDSARKAYARGKYGIVSLEKTVARTREEDIDRLPLMGEPARDSATIVVEQERYDAFRTGIVAALKEIRTKPEDRIILVGLYVQGRTTEEIGLELGLTREAVKSRLFQARRKLFKNETFRKAAIEFDSRYEKIIAEMDAEEAARKTRVETKRGKLKTI